MKLGEIIKKYRIDHSLTLRDFAKLCGMSHSYIAMLEDGKNSKTGEPMTPTLATLKKIASALSLTLNELMTIADDMPVKLEPISPTITRIAHSGEILDQAPDEMLESAEAMYVDPDSPLALLHKKAKKRPYLAPVLGYVAAGIPIEAITDIIDYEELDPEMVKDGATYFCLQIKGASMEPRFTEGDVVVVRQQPDVDSGQIAIVCINGDHATCKKVMKHSNGILLQPLNPAFEPTFYTVKEIASIPVTILGRVVELRAKF